MKIPKLSNPDNLSITLSVNGRIRQESNTSDMIFNCAEIISYISKYMTLKPGDIILTGTPEGVIMGQPENNRKWLKKGDKITELPERESPSPLGVGVSVN